MKSTNSHALNLLAGIVFLAFLSSRPALAQSFDSSRSATGNALQFQIVGGVGVYYIAGNGGSTFFRIGADASIHTTNSSGTQNSSTQSSGSSLSTSNTPFDQSGSSSEISVSGLWTSTIAEYSHVTMYAGAGPVGSYSYSKNSGGSVQNTGYYPGGNFTSTSNYVNTTSTWGLGPLALIGIRARLFNPVSLTAEMSFSAQYEWGTTTSISTTLSGSPIPYVNIESGETNSKGWSLNLRSIQIGVIIEL